MLSFNTPHALAVEALEHHHLAAVGAALHLVRHVAVVVVAILAVMGACGGLSGSPAESDERLLESGSVGGGAWPGSTLSPRSCWSDDALRLPA